MRSFVHLLLLAAVALLVGASRATGDPAPGLLIEGATVVTMDAAHTVIPHGSVLVRDGRIAAVWSGPQPRSGVSVANARVVEAGPNDLLFPGLINLHDHPLFDELDPWLPPASDALPDQGKAGTDPYANRYQWGAAGSPSSSPEERRLIANPEDVLDSPLGLGLAAEVNRYAQTAALVGGETTIEGGNGDVIGSVEDDAHVAPSYTGRIAGLAGAPLADLQTGLEDGRYDVWLLHLAEGVRDGDRRTGDTFSSRAEFRALKEMGSLTDATVIIHGTALERSDFAEMRAARSVGPLGSDDGLGAKLVWSPLSNLLLYGKTTNVYDALAEGVLVSLGTDWAPSGSRTLLDELKVADRALRDPRVLGGSRDTVPELAIDGKQGTARQRAEQALDRLLVDMVTRNPALALHEYDQIGSIEPGKRADLLLLHRPPRRGPSLGIPPSVYRALIDAGEREVELVLVAGQPRAGDSALMTASGAVGAELVTCTVGGFDKAVAIGTPTVAQTTSDLAAGLNALGGDHPPAGGGPGPADNTYSYLQAHVDGGVLAGLPAMFFRFLLASELDDTLPDGSLNLESIRLAPLFEQDDRLLLALLHGDLDPATGLVADPAPPYRLYPADLNFITPNGNPFNDLSPEATNG
jgi:5-methylthioadenosine/S-adenosylhomocysteine deaminase